MRMPSWLATLAATLIFIPTPAVGQAVVVPAAAHDLVFKTLAQTWDEALPLGNGMVGALVWRKDGKVRLSLDRADLWDLRPMENLKGPEWTWRWVSKRWRGNDYKAVQDRFDRPYDVNPAPTKIPAGAIEFDLAGFGEPESVRLFVRDGAGRGGLAGRPQARSLRSCRRSPTAGSGSRESARDSSPSSSCLPIKRSRTHRKGILSAARTSAGSATPKAGSRNPSEGSSIARKAGAASIMRSPWPGKRPVRRQSRASGASARNSRKTGGEPDAVAAAPGGALGRGFGPSFAEQRRLVAGILVPFLDRDPRQGPRKTVVSRTVQVRCGRPARRSADLAPGRLDGRQRQAPALERAISITT